MRAIAGKGEGEKGAADSASGSDRTDDEQSSDARYDECRAKEKTKRR